LTNLIHTFVVIGDVWGKLGVNKESEALVLIMTVVMIKLR
jgi:hypothetical protein